MHSRYSKLGVRTTEELTGFPAMLETLGTTLSLRDGRAGKPMLGFGQYANVLDVGDGRGLAISTDGVGTKIIVAELMRDFTTIGIDCVAMNVNDVICVGAEPIAMTDYLAIEEPLPEVLNQVAIGLRRGAELAHVTIPGGEIAQIREVVRGLDLAGTCVGLVRLDHVIVGRDVSPGDAIIGYASSGIHSNGLTLARKALVGADTESIFHVVPEFGRSIGEELLKPTLIYVDLAMSLIERVHVRALAHITSDGLLNLARIEAEVGFEISELPEIPAVFQIIQRRGNIPDEEMYLVYNMGIGFCVIVPEQDAAKAIQIGTESGLASLRIGTVTRDTARTVEIRPVRLRSERGHFVKTQ